MKYLYYSVIIILFSCRISVPDTEHDLPWIKVDGNQFITEEGQPITFHGLNASDPDKLDQEGHWNKEYFEAMQSWNSNIVRFPIHPEAWRKRGEDDYLKLIDKGIELAQSYGMYVILDWHSIGNLTTEQYQSDNYKTTLEETRAFWKTMAIRYGNNSTVAMFELFNEPTTIGGELGPLAWVDWKVIMESLIEDIRAHGAQNIPLVAGFNWAYDLTEAGNTPIQADNIGYVCHPYPQKREPPWEPKWDEDWGFLSDTHPVILTEIGFCFAGDKGEHSPVISDAHYVDHILNYANHKGISYVVWVFDPHWSPMLIKDWTYTPTDAGMVWKEALLNIIIN